MIKRLNIDGIINDIKNFIEKNKSFIAIAAALLFVLIIVILIIIFIQKFIQNKKFKSNNIDDKKSLSEELTNQVIDWVENYDYKNSFLNEQYDKFIRNVCLKSDLYKKLFDESIKQENKDSILYHDMKIIERNSSLTNIRSNYPLLHKEFGITKDELNFYISKYIEKKFDDAKVFSLKIKKMNHFKYTDIEEFFEKYKSDQAIELFERGDSNAVIKKIDADYEFFFRSNESFRFKF